MIALSSVAETPMAWATVLMRSGGMFIVQIELEGGVLFSDHASDQKTDGHGQDSADEARNKERVIDHVLANPRRSGTVEVNRGHDGAVGRKEEVAVYGGKHTNQQKGPDAKRKAERHEGAGRR